MKCFVPSGLLLVGMFVAGCNTPENTFMAGETPIAAQPVAPVVKPAPVKPVKPVKPVAPPTTAILIVPSQKPKLVAMETNPPVIMVNAPPLTVTNNPPPAVAPVVMVPDDATPAPTMPAEAPSSPAPAPEPVALPTIVTPDTSLAGKVVAYNTAGRFVVLSFPPGPMPQQGQDVFLYRGGMKAGEIKITGPQSGSNTVGDVIDGDAQVGDEVRDQ